MKLWAKGIETNKEVERFTVGRDREFDLLLAPWDVLGSLAHAQMLNSVGLLQNNEYQQIRTELISIYKDVTKPDFQLDPSMEDIHSQVEWVLTEKIGEAGKKLHSARSRNDQVLTDIKLFLRNEIKEIVELISSFSTLLLEKAEEHKDIILPGYTHLQIAMPSSFGLWFSAYAESLDEDLELIQAAYNVCNKNPLGSGAGYGGSFPIDRELTTTLLGFESCNVNSVYAQMTRGKAEKSVAYAIAGLAHTLSKLSYDSCLYMSQNFGFIKFPDNLTTGSSIMPHKKNPDMWELIRGKCNVLQAVPQQLTLLTNNLTSGYFRDYQLTKECLFPALGTIKDCLNACILMISNIEVNKDIIHDKLYDYMFSVENMNEKVIQGIPMRDAYKQIASEIKEGKFKPNKDLNHTHLGSIGNLGLDKIKSQIDCKIKGFRFNHWENQLSNLTKA